MEAIRYAIIDGAIEEGLLDFLKRINPPHCCLYAEPIQPDLVALAPYLVEVIPEVDTWLQAKDSPWGIYMTSELCLRDLQQHFRHYLWITIPEQEKPVLMRYYDPRNIWAIVKILTDRQLLSFIGPINKLSTYYDGEYHEENFSSIRRSEPTRLQREHMTLLSLTYRQYRKLEQQAQENYIEQISCFISESAGNMNLMFPLEKLSSKSLAVEYFSFCQSLNITDDISIKKMVLILLKRNIIDTRSIPEEWYSLLSDLTYPGHGRVQKLASHEFGSTPQQSGYGI
ncbi:TPA: DUF4123 domain-containing protein [Enterobacter cloacae]|nr:DUF4123 domain-containing protein [Enterobacter cloacae]HAS1151897.1 DUF4123 domain-containing protein [Enterobacter cloacae]